ncbi:MAG: electron transfer flavoprotein subunit beta/FixA family protein [Candidatus Bathyarchaeia archaeon]
MVNIVVGIKWVPDTVDVKFDSEKGTLIRAGVESVINPPDLNAIEMALTLRDEYGGKVFIVSMAPPSAIEGLKMAIAMGADEAILISDKKFAGADTLATSYTLAKALQKISNVDFAIFGEETIDSSTGHIGPEVGEVLNVAHLSYVKKIEINQKEKNAILFRDVEDGSEVFESSLPIVISVAVGTNTPRYPIPIRRLLTEVKTEDYIKTWHFDDLQADPDRVGLKGSPTKVVKVKAAPMPARRREIFDFSEKGIEMIIKKLSEVDIG